jgi:hypothetical protein
LRLSELPREEDKITTGSGGFRGLRVRAARATNPRLAYAISAIVARQR